MMDFVELKTTWKTAFVLMCLWLVATGYNITKPYHIDDPAYMEIAQGIAQNPLRPMNGLLNWADFPEPIHKLNQPHLYFYLLAFHLKFFGETELSTHLFQSVFVLLGIFFFFKLAQVHGRDKALLLSVLLVFCPAFLVGQNLMVDIPLLLRPCSVLKIFALCLQFSSMPGRDFYTLVGF